jgi:hypothetical protein
MPGFLFYVQSLKLVTGAHYIRLAMCCTGLHPVLVYYAPSGLWRRPEGPGYTSEG